MSLLIVSLKQKVLAIKVERSRYANTKSRVSRFDIQATDGYQKQLKALYLTVSDNQYQRLTVLIDLNAYRTAVFDLLDCGIDLLFI